MNSAKKLYTAFYIISFCFNLNAQTVFLPFNNASAYEGSWKLSTAVPDYFADLLKQKTDSSVISTSTFIKSSADNRFKNENISEMETFAELYRQTGYRFIVSGSIEKFDINRYMIEEPSTIGYEYYTCDFACKIKMVDAKSGTILVDDILEVSETRNGLGINILGKPSENKSQFFSLDKIAFGTEEFRKTLPGITLGQWYEKFFSLLAKSVYFKNQFKPVPDTGSEESKPGNENSITATIIYGDTVSGECYVSVARELIKPGDIFISGSKESNTYCEMVILEIKGDNLAFAVINKGKAFISAGKKFEKMLKKG